MDNLAASILQKLNLKGEIDSTEFKENQESIHGQLMSLKSKKMVEYKAVEEEYWLPTEEGMDIITNGSHEVKFFNLVGESGILSNEELEKNIGKVHAFKNQWVKKVENKFVRCVEEVHDKIQDSLKKLKNEKADSLTNDEINVLKRRKLIVKCKKVHYLISKGELFSTSIEDLSTDITSAMVLDNSYVNLKFKDYNFNTKGNLPASGNLHPLLKVKEEFKKIFIEMGFTEMSTNQYVESSFWNFDALFQPQHHPSREAHDTFFIKNPAVSSSFPDGYVDSVSKIHSVGGYGSTGYMSKWEMSEAMKNILRTHTTAASTRYLYKAAKKNFEPLKLFSIDKVFRNESVDATHLAEFNQVEGLIAGKNLTLGHLMGVLQNFFEKLKMPQIKFKPAYNPYTEPSMEVFGYHEGLGKWIEVGNSGIFRPEMLKPMGFDDDVRVIAWGLSLERPTMIKYGINNIRELVGHKVDIEFIKNSEVCFF